jgi:hypothetical protein
MDERTIEERIDTLANLASTLIDCVSVLAKASIDPTVKVDITSKLGAFIVSEQRDAK